MQVTELTIKKAASYEDFSGQLVGMVALEGSSGSQKVRLSAASIGRIFSIITAEVQETSLSNSRLVKRAMAEAEHAPLLEAAATVGSLE